jgi:hypothetical protein
MFLVSFPSQVAIDQVLTNTLNVEEASEHDEQGKKSNSGPSNRRPEIFINFAYWTMNVGQPQLHSRCGQTKSCQL